MQPRVVVLHDWPPPDTVSSAAVLRSGLKLVVCYGTSEERTAVVTFPHTSALKVSGPNDEALSGHPLFEFGLRHYSVHKIDQSPWLHELERINAVHPNHDRSRYLAGKVHYLLTLKEETIECIASELTGGPPKIEIASDWSAALNRLKGEIDA